MGFPGFFNKPAGIISGLLIYLMFASFLVPLTALEVDTIIGFNGYYSRGRWTPVTVIVNNDGMSVTGELIIELTKKDYNNNSSVINYKKEVNLPGNSKKQFSFVVPIDKLTRNAQVRVETEDSVIFSKEIDLDRREISGEFILCLSRRASLDFLQKEPFSSGNNRLQVLYPHAELLPEKWTGYDGVSLIVIHDAPIRMKNSQIEAINMWVQSGGTLIISGGAHFTASHGTSLSPIMPVSYLGLIRKDKMSGLEEYTGADLKLSGNVLLTSSFNNSGTLIIDEEGIPILVEEKRGNGNIFFLAFDYADKNFIWPGRETLWKTMTGNISAPDSLPFEQKKIINNDLVTRLLKPVDGILFSKLTILIVILIYFGFTLFFILLNRKLQKTGLKIVYAIILPVSFSIAAWFLFYEKADLKQSLFMDISVINTSVNNGIGFIDKDILIASLAESIHNVNVPNKLAVISQIKGENLSVNELSGRNTLSIENIILNRWGFKSFHIQSQVTFPITGSVSINDNIVDLSIINKTGYEILDSVIIYKNNVYYTGSFSPTGIINTVVSLSENSPEESDNKWKYFKERGKPFKQAIIDYLLTQSTQDNITGKAKLVIAGWLKENPLKIEPENEFKNSKEINLVLITIDIGKEADETI